MRQRGAIAIMFAGVLIVIIGFFALALDLGRIYNRRAELHALSDFAAIAAAGKLDGTAQGVLNALAAARAVAEDESRGARYDYSATVGWSDSALMFSAARDGSTGWKTAGSASASDAAAADLAYVKVDTSQLGGDYGNVGMLFIPIVSSQLSTVVIGHTSIAGRVGLNVTPLAVCAMSTQPAEKRVNVTGNSQYDELVEYGFRRGVSYDLMNLNPKATTPANYLLDPIALAGSASTAYHFDEFTVGPFLCTGTMSVTKVVGATVNVQSPFPVKAFAGQLNSRFGLEDGKCDPSVAPPDQNIKQYKPASSTWVSPTPTNQSARSVTDTAAEKLHTVAGVDPPNSYAAADFGPLWTSVRAVPWSSYTGAPEPAGGYAPFAPASTTAAISTVWKNLYSSGLSANSYPSSATGISTAMVTPYLSSGSLSQQPATPLLRPGVRYRRVLNVPLLSCPVTGSTATVLAIGRFFMMVPVDTTNTAPAALYAEFAGLTTEARVRGSVEVY